MKKCFVKYTSVLIAVLLLVLSSSGQVYAQELSSENIVNDTVAVSSLLDKINDARKEVSKAGLTQNPGLDKVAYDYASDLINAGSDFRKKTDFQTLVNGERVFSLAAANGITGISNFDYSVWLGGYPNLELTNEFAKKAVNGEFANIGIASCTNSDGYNVVVLIFSN